MEWPVRGNLHVIIQLRIAPSQVKPKCVPGRSELCPWSGVFPLQVRCISVTGLRFGEATEKGIYYTSLRESTLHNNPPEFSYSDECSTLRRMFAF